MTEQNQYAPSDANLNTDTSEFSTPTIFGFAGRIGRVRYIAYSAIGIIAFYFALIIPAVLAAMFPLIGGLLLIVCIILFVVLSFSWPIRRLHDLNHSGWLVLLQLIPLVNIGLALYLLFGAGTKGRNNYDAEPIPNSTGVIIAAWSIPVMIALIGILAAISIPAYQDYIERAEASAAQMEALQYQDSEYLK